MHPYLIQGAANEKFALHSCTTGNSDKHCRDAAITAPDAISQRFLNQIRGCKMKFRILFSLLLSSLLCTQTGLADADSISGQLLEKCGALPEQPPVPNGRQASEEEMVAAQKAMKAFLAEGNEYIECMSALEGKWGEEATDEQRSVIVMFNNKIVDEQQAIADLFNAAVRAFKGKQ